LINNRNYGIIETTGELNMKKLIFVFIFVIGTGAFGIYGQTKNDDIIKLLKISGADKLAEQLMTAMIPQFQQIIPDIPNTFWVKFREKISIDDLLYACIPAYNKYYTHDEIKQLINFYESPLGKRLIEITPLLAQETMVIGQEWGEKLGQEIVNELIKEGYIN
jgi:hypothetical protein